VSKSETPMMLGAFLFVSGPRFIVHPWYLDTEVSIDEVVAGEADRRQGSG